MIIRKALTVGALIVGAALASATSAHAAGPAGVALSAHPLGVNVSPRQPNDPVVTGKIDHWLSTLGPVSIRYGGGTLGDAYFYDVNRDTYDCTEQYTADPSRSCSRGDTLNLSDVEAEASAIGADVMPIANYGSGTTGLAGGMAKAAVGSSSIELGNEPYGCGSIINELTKPPTSDTGYEHGVYSTCPYLIYGSTAAGLKAMGQSFLTYAPGFINAIKASHPGIKVEFPYAISPAGNSGYVWNDTVMPVLKNYDGLVVLWYPAYGAPNQSDTASLNALRFIPGAAAKIRADVAKYAPGKPWQIGETNDTNANNVLTCRPAGAVFAAGDALGWLSQGASNVNWWDETDPVNGNTCVNPDFAMFSSNGTPQAPYFGYWMAARLAQPHAELFKLVDTGYQQEYQSYLAHGHRAYAYVNESMTASHVFTAPSTAAYTQYAISVHSDHVLTSHPHGLKSIKIPAGTVIVLTR